MTPSEDARSERTRSQKRGRALVLQSIALALGLCVLKVAAGLATHSLALMASALDSLMDMLSSIVNYLSLSLSQQPADDDHLYGHGKVEGMAGAAQGAVIALSGLALLVEATRRVVSGAPVSANAFGIGVMVLSMVVSVVHGMRLRRAAEDSRSTILEAEGLHFSMDVLANLGVLLALVFMRFGASPMWDVVISLIVGGFIVKEAVSLMTSSVHELMDRRLSDEVHEQIKDVIFGHHKSIIGFHDLRTRRAGDKIFIDFHVEIAGVEKFREAHEITESLIDKIKQKLPNADVTVHPDPEGEC